MAKNTDIATKASASIAPAQIENRILTIRGIQVMIDRDIGELYGIPTKRLNEQVKRNKERFPEHFCFQLSENETNELVANCDRLQMLKHSSVSPYCFTEQGVAMLSAVLRTETICACKRADYGSVCRNATHIGGKCACAEALGSY